MVILAIRTMTLIDARRTKTGNKMRMFPARSKGKVIMQTFT